MQECKQGCVFQMKRKIIPYNPRLKKLARELRNNSTFSEVLLWKQLRNYQIRGYDFHRQKPLLEYIVDFYCHELNLIIEIDGASHRDEEVYANDLKRQKELENLGLYFLRFSDLEIKKNIINVMNAIEEYIFEFEKHTPNPS